MKRLLLALLTILGSALVLPLAGGAQQGKEKKVVVHLGELRSAVPANWVREKPSNEMRLAQFRLPGAKGSAGGEVIVYGGIGGDLADNVKRWQALFTPPRGKTIDEVTTKSEVVIAGRKAAYIDIRGTLNAGPGDKPAENYRRIAVRFPAPDKVYYIIAVGPAATIEHHKKGLDDWLKAFKKD